MSYDSSRLQLFETVVQTYDSGLIRPSAGNISMRLEDGRIAITPSGILYRLMTPEDISIIDLDGTLIEGPKPSSECPMRTAIYRQLAKVGGICHTHSIYAIAFSMLGEEISRANLELAVCGAPIPVAPWVVPGSHRAGEVLVEAISSQPELKLALLRNHGALAIGKNLEHAYTTAYNAEVGFKAYHLARQLGQPSEITDDQYAEIIKAYNLEPFV